MTKKPAKKSPAAKRVDTVFRAFADFTRLRILRLLLGGVYCVGDIVEILRLEQPSVSRHLAYLRRAGLVAVRKDGLWSYYSLSAAQAPFHEKLLECLASCFSEVPQLEKDAARAENCTPPGGIV